MRVLVKNANTGLFLKGDNLWTNEAVEARDFGSGVNAIQGAFAMHLTHPDIILSFGDPSLDMKISLGDLRFLQPAGSGSHHG
jgi:hypothetical protein